MKIFTDSQVPKHSISKKDLVIGEPRLVKTMEHCVIFSITLKSLLLRVLGYTFSRAPHAKVDTSLNDLDVPFIRF